MFPLKDNVPTSRPAYVTLALIAINCIVYFFLQPKSGIDFSGNSLDQRDLTHYGAIPYEFTHWGDHCDLDAAANAVACQGQPGISGTPGSQPATILTVFTSMFTHAGLLHLGGNMLFLWIFGNNVEDSMGRVKFIGFYLLGGIAALALQIAVGPNSTAPTLGASGAIAAVLGGYLVLYPRARVLTLVFIVFFVTIIQVPAMIFLFIWIAEQILFVSLELSNPTGASGGVAYFAHIGGFIFGAAVIRLLATNRNAPLAT